MEFPSQGHDVSPVFSVSKTGVSLPPVLRSPAASESQVPIFPGCGAQKYSAQIPGPLL